MVIDAAPHPGRLFCRTCGEPRIFSPPLKRPEWAFCGVCGTRLGEAPRYAGFWIRAAGHLFDEMILLLAGVAWVAGAALLTASQLTLASSGDVLTASGLLTIPYVIAGNARGATLGKLVFRLRVVEDRGGRPGLKRSIVRYVISIFSGLLVAYGYWRVVFDDEKQTWHDVAAGTHVVRV
jgi:uncharacterized RDD family membrane protein YckC